jgi:hypothetical protein
MSELLWFQKRHSQINQEGQGHDAADDIDGAHASPAIIRSKASINQTEEKHRTPKSPKQKNSNMFDSFTFFRGISIPFNYSYRQRNKTGMTVVIPWLVGISLSATGEIIRLVLIRMLLGGKAEVLGKY